MGYEKIIETTKDMVSNSDFYWQSLSLLGCFVISYVFYYLTKKIILPKIISAAHKRNLALNRFITRYIVSLLYPLFAVIFLTIGLSIYSQLLEETILFSTTLKLVTLFLFLRFLRILTNNSFVSNIAGAFLIPSLILDIFGLFYPAIDYLDQYALKIGAVRISVYLVIKAFIVLLVLFWASGLIIKKSKSYIKGNKAIKSRTKGIISKFIDVTVYTTVFIIILKTFGVDMTTLAFLGGAIGVGIGFGLQRISSNFISGIILLFEKSVEVGDWIEIENGSILGIIKHFGGRYTLVERFDGKEVMVPNEDFIIGKVTNLTYTNNRARIEIETRVSYDSDLDKVKEILTESATQHPRCLTYPGVECYLEQFDEYDIKFTLFFWINDLTQGRMSAKSEVMYSIWNNFKKNNIQIPFPQRQVSITSKNVLENS